MNESICFLIAEYLNLFLLLCHKFSITHPVQRYDCRSPASDVCDICDPTCDVISLFVFNVAVFVRFALKLFISIFNILTSCEF